MARTWANFEERVRDIGSLIWGKRPEPENVGRVDIDAVLHLDPQLSILIEITEERNLGKVRDDVAKLVTAMNALYTQHTIARCFCVINSETVTEGMVGAGKPHNIRVMTVSEFEKMFFDFPQYKVTRLNAPFGSAVNPLTGEKDETEYVPVRYTIDGSRQDIGTREIADYLRGGKHVVLLGEYGSGKSRCIRETFKYLSESTYHGLCHPLAIDLRDAWGLKRGVELVQRHMSDLGLDSLSGNAVRAMNAGALAFLLDGFDELGSQAWNNDPARLRAIRAQALLGVKDIVRRAQTGILVAGREHYFPSNDELVQAIGVDISKLVVIRSKEEFTDAELQEFFDQRGIDVEIPEWLPRRPLICQTINNLPEDDREEMFNVGASETAFWDHFIRVLCARDARINVAFDASTIYQVLLNLARITRTRSANVGPLSLSDMQRAFEDAVGQSPGEEASVMLQRLPSLGRLGTDSDERQFTDTYILDGLRAKDVGNIALLSPEDAKDVLGTAWTNPLDLLGQRILASDNGYGDGQLVEVAQRASNSKNRTLASDIIAALLLRNRGEVDFEGLELIDGNFLRLDFSHRPTARLTIKEAVLGQITLPATDNLRQVKIENSLAERVFGATSLKGVPSWMGITADSYDSAENTAGIRRIGLKPSHQILATTIRKTFFQKGAGRKEEALTRGFSKIGSPGLTGKILNILQRERLIEKVKGKEGWLYIPVRGETGRMQKIMAELSSSHDPLWTEIGDLN